MVARSEQFKKDFESFAHMSNVVPTAPSPAAHPHMSAPTGAMHHAEGRHAGASDQDMAPQAFLGNIASALAEKIKPGSGGIGQQVGDVVQAMGSAGARSLGLFSADPAQDLQVQSFLGDLASKLGGSFGGPAGAAIGRTVGDVVQAAGTAGARQLGVLSTDAGEDMTPQGFLGNIASALAEKIKPGSGAIGQQVGDTVQAIGAAGGRSLGLFSADPAQDLQVQSFLGDLASKLGGTFGGSTGATIGRIAGDVVQAAGTAGARQLGVLSTDPGQDLAPQGFVGDLVVKLGQRMGGQVAPPAVAQAAGARQLGMLSTDAGEEMAPQFLGDIASALAERIKPGSGRIGQQVGDVVQAIGVAGGRSLGLFSADPAQDLQVQSFLGDLASKLGGTFGGSTGATIGRIAGDVVQAAGTAGARQLGVLSTDPGQGVAPQSFLGDFAGIAGTVVGGPLGGILGKTVGEGVTAGARKLGLFEATSDYDMQFLDGYLQGQVSDLIQKLNGYVRQYGNLVDCVPIVTQCVQLYGQGQYVKALSKGYEAYRCIQAKLS